jgi:hypothetical protein
MSMQPLCLRRISTFRKKASLIVAAAALLFMPVTSRADPVQVAITSGSTFLYWDGSLSGFSLAGDGFSMIGEHHGGGVLGWQVGSTASLTGSFSPLTPAGDPDGLVHVVVNDVAYDAFLVGTITMATESFIVPSIPPGESWLFSLPFLASGRIQGYAQPFDTSSTLLFDIAVRGSGIASTSGHTSIDGSFVIIPGVTYVFGDGGGNAPVPEPGSMLLFATGLAGLAGLHRKRPTA